MLRLSFYFLLFIFPFSIFAQQENYIFHHLTSKDGLASDYIQSIFQDSKGFYWIGTTSGLQKFDGYTFSKPLTIDNVLLPSSTVTETKGGTLWISNENSLFRYNQATGHFIRIMSERNKSKMYLRIIEDSLGNIWLLNDLVLYKYDTTSGKLITWMKMPSANPVTSFGGIAFDKKTDVIWVQKGSLLYKIFPFKKKIIRLKTIPYGAANIWMDDSTYLWMSFWTQYLCRYNTITEKKDWYKMPFKITGRRNTNYALASCFARDETGKLWIGSIYGGLWYFDESLNKVLQLRTDNLKPESFHYNESVYLIFIDKTSNIWVGSDRGINVFNPSSQQFHTIYNADLPTKGIPSSIIQKPFETSTGDILIGTDYGGWLLYDNNFHLKQNFTVILTANSSNTDKIKTSVICFAEDKKGKIWMGHLGGLIEVYNPKTGSIKYRIVPEFKKSKICSIQRDGAGNMWFALGAASNNLAKWDNGTKQYKVYNDSLLMNRGQQESAITITRQGAIWVHTFGNGIYRFDPIKEKIAEIYREEQPPCNIPNMVTSIAPLNDSIIGVASWTEGFFLFNSFQRTTVPLSTNEGLPSNIAKAIALDSRNRFWLAMLSHLMLMDPHTKKIVSFDEEEGVLNKSFIDANGFTKLHDGRLFIVSNTGLLYFHPDSIKTQSPPPDVILTGLKVYGNPVLLDSVLTAGNKLNLSHDQNFLTIDYVSISYVNRNTTQYFYQLKGVDKSWVNAGTQRFASYTNLSPGHYVFKVKCENRDGIPSKKITQLSIYISPPWWLTWWAYILYALLIVSVVYSLYRNNIRQLKNKQAAQIKAMVATQEEERKRISRDLHDDVGTKLSALKLFLSSLHEKASETKNEEIKSLTKSSEQFIKEAMQDVRQLLLNLSPTVLEEFGYTTAVEGLVNKINETKQIHFSLIVFGMKQRLQKDYELALYRITQELINNVLKHAEAKHVSLQIGQRDEKIILMMEDDGKGFDINAHKDGYGLNNLDARAKLMNGTITIDSQPGKGTSVLIEVPYDFT